MKYVSLPDEFIAIRFPGYFWNIESQKLFSMKVDGVLKELKVRKPYVRKGVRLEYPFYCLSVNGFKRYVFVKDLKNLIPMKTEIPVRG